MKRVRKRYGKNNVISYRTVLDKKYRTVISYCTFTLKNTITYRNSVPYRTVQPPLHTILFPSLPQVPLPSPHFLLLPMLFSSLSHCCSLPPSWQLIPPRSEKVKSHISESLFSRVRWSTWRYGSHAAASLSASQRCQTPDNTISLHAS